MNTSTTILGGLLFLAALAGAGAGTGALTGPAAADNKAVAEAMLRQADKVGTRNGSWEELVKDGPGIARKFDLDAVMSLFIRVAQPSEEPGAGHRGQAQRPGQTGGPASE